MTIETLTGLYYPVASDGQMAMVVAQDQEQYPDSSASSKRDSHLLTFIVVSIKSRS
jgi:hypothetical protein